MQQQLVPRPLVSWKVLRSWRNFECGQENYDPSGMWEVSKTYFWSNSNVSNCLIELLSCLSDEAVGLTNFTYKWQFDNSVVINYKYFTDNFVAICNMHLSVHCYLYYICMIMWTFCEKCNWLSREVTPMIFLNCSRNQGATLSVGDLCHYVMITVSIFNVLKLMLVGNSDLPD